MVIGSIVGLLALIGGITLYRTFALFEEKKEFNVLQGRIPDIKKDVQLAFTINGESSNRSFPNKGEGYVAKNAVCDNGAMASWDNYSWGLINIEAKESQKVKCNIDFVESLDLYNQSKVGDYVQMTPISTSYTISKDLTGFNYDQTINPSELKLWRIIEKNSGLLTMVSEYVSSESVSFSGETGYRNYTLVLNMIESQYVIGNYTASLVIPGLSSSEVSSLILTGPLLQCYEENTYRTYLIESALGGLGAREVERPTNASLSPYWVVGRGYDDFGRDLWGGSYVDTNGSFNHNDPMYDGNGNLTPSNGIRPIFSVAGVHAYGSGTKEDPWVLS